MALLPSLGQQTVTLLGPVVFAADSRPDSALTGRGGSGVPGDQESSRSRGITRYQTFTWLTSDAWQEQPLSSAA